MSHHRLLAARFNVSGKIQKAFHRMSTQHINELSEGDGTLNAFVDKNGRLLDLTFHLQTKNDACLLLGQTDSGQALIEWLEQFHFIEKINFEDLSASLNGALVIGKTAIKVVADYFNHASHTLKHWHFLNQ